MGSAVFRCPADYNESRRSRLNAIDNFSTSLSTQHDKDSQIDTFRYIDAFE